MRAVAGIGLLVAASLGCFRDPVAVEPTDTTVTLIGLVRAGTDTLSVLLARVEPVQGPRPEPGAQLRIDTPSGSAPLVERPGEACGLTQDVTCLQAAYPEPPAPGDVVRITGRTGSGQPVEGSTTVPAPTPLALESGGPLPDTVRVERFARVPLVLPEGYRRRISGIAVRGRVWAGGEMRTCDISGGSEALIRGYPEPSSLSLHLPGNPSCDPPLQARWDSAHVDVEILTFDDAFSGYLEAAEGRPPAYLEDSRWGLEGVTGAFGSVTPRKVVIVATP